jgi:hypothetical protein
VPSFAKLYFRAFVRPRRALEAVLAEPRRLRYGGYAVAITALSYQLVYFFLAHNGGRPTDFRPWLNIPAAEYYHYDQFFVVPSILLAWIAAAGCTQLAARAFGGTGSWEDTLTVLGFGISVSTWWSGLHDLVTSLLGYVGIIDQRTYEDALSTPGPFSAMLWVLYAGYTTWFVLTFTKGVGAAHRLRTGAAFVAGFGGVLVYSLIFALFNR